MIRDQASGIRHQGKQALWALIAACWLPLAAWAADAAALFAAQLGDAQDKPATLAAFRGKPLIVNFWARWCPPCRDELPEVKAIADKYRARGLTVIGIALEDDS
ncbi:MAG: TlpA disulfide reductase family protein, partial [Rhodocyclaceae bacterium]